MAYLFVFFRHVFCSYRKYILFNFPEEICCSFLLNHIKGIVIQVGYVFDSTNWPIWGCSDAWAPELHHVEGRFLVYFSMQHTETRSHAIGVAISSGSALGPFTDYGTPLVEHPSGTIDVHWFKDPKCDRSTL